MSHTFVCIRCNESSFREIRTKTFLCFDCSGEHKEESKLATRHVAKQIRLGAIPKAKDCICVDCGNAAFDYDHRDYLKPLDVVPVCRSCNQSRGLALDSKLRSIPAHIQRAA